MVKGISRRRGRRGRSILLPMALAGVLGIAVGGSLVMGTAHVVVDADAGDWLAFSGALLGVMLTIAAAVWIEDRKRAVEESAQIALVYDALENLRVAFERLDEPLSASDAIEGIRIVSVLEDIAEAVETLAFMRQHAAVADVLVWRQIREIERKTDDAIKPVSSLRDRMASASLPIEEVRWYRTSMIHVAYVVRPMLFQAMERLRPGI